MADAVVCQLCGKPISLESARINEFGKPVHQECYVTAIRQAKVEGSKANPGSTKSA